MTACLILLATLPGTAAAETRPATAPAARSRSLDNPFFAMDTATRDERHQTIESQLRLVRELGFAGWSTCDTATVGQSLRIADDLGLKLFAVYVRVDLDGQDPPWDPKLPEVIETLKGRDTVVWLYVLSKKHAPASEAGDEAATPIVRRIADMAARARVNVSFYPHYGFYVATVRDALRLIRRVDRPNVGLTFNLCHWLRADRGKDLDALLKEALPHLHLVTINGADAEGDDWGRLIQVLGRGSFDVYGLLLRLHRLGFHGPVGLQGYGVKGDVRENLTQAMTAWRQYAGRLARQQMREHPQARERPGAPPAR